MPDNSYGGKAVKSSQIFGDYLIMLAAPFVLSCIGYGIKAFYVTAVSVVTAVICDAAGSAVLGRRYRFNEFIGVFTGAAIAMMMPADVPLHIPAIASAFAVLVVKIPLGGGLRLPFVPAAAGFAFACVCFKEEVFNYGGANGRFLGASSIGSLLMQGSSVHLNIGNTFDIICGNAAGPMGTGCVLVMLACCVYLFVKRKKALLSTLGFVAVCAVFAFLFPRVNASRLTSVILELCSGSLMFAAVFFATDYSTLPKKDGYKVIFGAICGLLCMVMRRTGAYEEPVCFAVLLADALGQLLDYVPEKRKGAVNGER